MSQHWDSLPEEVEEVYLVFVGVSDYKGATIAPGVDSPPKGFGTPIVSGAWSKDRPNEVTDISSAMVKWELVQAKRLDRSAPKEHDDDYVPKRSLGFRPEFDN